MKVRFLAAAAAVVASLSAHALRLDLLPVPATINLPGTTTLSLVASGLDADAQIVSSYDIFLSYDASLVDATAVTFGVSLGGPADSLQMFDLATPGAIEISEVSFLTDAELEALQGDMVTLALLSFSGIASGTSPVEFTSVLMTGTAAGEIQPDQGGTRIIVQQASVPEPGSLLLLLAGLFALPVFARRTSRIGLFAPAFAPR